MASTQPDPICGACGSSFETAASERGVSLNVSQTAASVRIHDNGSATWVVTNRIQNSTRDLSTTPDTLARISQRAAVSGGLPQDTEPRVTFQSATMENRTVRIQFRDPAAGTRHLGVLVVDYFHSGGSSGGWLLNADRFSISGPAGTEVLNDPRSIIDDEYATADELPTVADNTLTWQQTVTNDDETTLYEEFYIAYGEATTEEVRVSAAVAMASVPIWLANVEGAVLPAAFVYAILLLGVTVGSRRAAETEWADVDSISTLIAGVGLVFGILAVIGPATLIGVGTLYLAVGVIALRRPRLFRSVRGTLVVGCVSTLAVGGVLLGAGVLDPRFGNLAPTVAHAMVFHLPLAVAPAFGLGVTESGGHQSRWATVAAVTGGCVAFILAGAVFVPFEFRPWGLLLGTIGGAFLAAIFGLPLSILAVCRSTTDDLNLSEND